MPFGLIKTPIIQISSICNNFKLLWLYVRIAKIDSANIMLNKISVDGKIVKKYKYGQKM